MRPFLLLSTREAPVAVEEHRTYLELTGLSESELAWIRADEESLETVDPSAFAGVILAGSPYTVSDPLEQKSAVQRRVERELQRLLDQVLADCVPFLGICYGIGTLSAHEGALVDRTFGETPHAATIRVSEAGRLDPLFCDLPETFQAFVGHKEAITAPAASMTVLATSEQCPVQAIRVGECAYATQFHPELHADAFAHRIRAYASHGYFAPEETESIVAAGYAADVQAAHHLLRRFVEIFSDGTAREEW